MEDMLRVKKYLPPGAIFHSSCSRKRIYPAAESIRAAVSVAWYEVQLSLRYSTSSRAIVGTEEGKIEESFPSARAEANRALALLRVDFESSIGNATRAEYPARLMFAPTRLMHRPADDDLDKA